MKTLKTILFSLLMSASCGMFAQDVQTITFESYFGSMNSGDYQERPTQNKYDRLSADAGTAEIRAVISDELKALDPLAEFIIKDALSVWREYLTFETDLEEDVDIYFESSNALHPNWAYQLINQYVELDDQIKYPIILAMAKTNQNYHSDSIIVRFNTADREKWYFVGQQDIAIADGQYDFKMAVFRALAQLFGFKSSLQLYSRPKLFTQSFPNVYDLHVSNGQTALGYFDINDRAVETFVQSDNIYWGDVSDNLKLYAPTRFAMGQSIDFFDEESSLMCYDFKSKTGNWNIDAKTLKVLQDIGWKVNEKNLIISGNIPQSGIVSLFSNYTFDASTNVGSVTDYQWEYRIYKKAGGYSVVQSATTPTFSITTPQDVDDDWLRSSTGDLMGQIHLTAKVNGKTETAFKSLYMECFPEEISINYQIEPIDDYTYRLQSAASSLGSKRFTVSIVNRSTGISSGTTYLENNYVSAYSAVLYYEDRIQIKVVATNEFGQRTKTVNVSANSVKKTTLDKRVINSPQRYELYSISTGQLVLTATSKEKLRYVHEKGLFVLLAKDENGNVLSREKIVVH